MKTSLLFILLCASSVCFAQNTKSDSSVMVQSIGTSSYEQTVAPANLYTQGRVDAEKHYKKYKGAATGTLITSLISPLVGLIPAIACSATTPKVENLGYPDEKLFMQKEYHDSYTKRAKKIKSGKVWKNWGIAFGVNLVAVLVISASAGR